MSLHSREGLAVSHCCRSSEVLNLNNSLNFKMFHEIMKDVFCTIQDFFGSFIYYKSSIQFLHFKKFTEMGENAEKILHVQNRSTVIDNDRVTNLKLKACMKYSVPYSRTREDLSK